MFVILIITSSILGLMSISLLVTNKYLKKKLLSQTKENLLLSATIETIVDDNKNTVDDKKRTEKNIPGTEFAERYELLTYDSQIVCFFCGKASLTDMFCNKCDRIFYPGTAKEIKKTVGFGHIHKKCISCGGITVVQPAGFENKK